MSADYFIVTGVLDLYSLLSVCAMLCAYLGEQILIFLHSYNYIF